MSSGVAETDLESDDARHAVDTAAVEWVIGFLDIEIRLSETELHPGAKICHANNVKLPFSPCDW